MKEAILLLSGGIDSTTLLAKLNAEEYHITALVFNYGQTLQKEIQTAQQNALLYTADCVTIDMSFDWMPGSCSILNHHQAEIATNRTLDQIRTSGTPSSYVPFRNGIFLAYAVALGESKEIQDIYCGGNGLNSGLYWDDTSRFAALFTTAAQEGTTPDYKPVVHYPFANMTKSQIVEIGLDLSVDYETTWSCYDNKKEHCGICDSCVQRTAAFDGVN